MQRQVTKRQVQVIQPTINTGFMQSTLAPVIKKRVAAYARVSTEHEEQQTSYDAQVDYYTKKIKERTDWVFVEVYTDKGITGTNTKRREGFNRMVKDALDGKIDLILTKSVSRFARNTVDTLTTIRKLKERGVAVYFEEQSINTLDGKGELLITIMSSRSVAKAGKEWRISELTDIPRRGFEGVQYRWWSELPDIPDGLEYIKEFRLLTLVKSAEDKYMAIFSEAKGPNSKRLDKVMENEERERLETFFIGNPLVEFANETITYNHKKKVEPEEEYDEEDCDD